MGAEKLGVTIGIGNQKGGVGKSTTTVHLAAALGEKGYRCLVIDLDPSAGATKHLGIPPNSFAGTLELLTTAEPPERLAINRRTALRCPAGATCSGTGCRSRHKGNWSRRCSDPPG